MNDLEITCAEVRDRLQSDARDFALIDCREPEEWRICRIESATLIPMSDTPAHLSALDTEREIIVYCHHGRRSLHVVAYLRQQGFAKARSMRGGIDEWSRSVDPTVPVY